MYAFDYLRAKTLDEAARAHAGSANARLIAGGQTLIPTLKQRLAQPDLLIDISRLEALRAIEIGTSGITIGAGVTHSEVASDPRIQKALPALAGLAAGIGDPHVRHRGTLGGSLANNDPAADYPAAALALGATLLTNEREIMADGYFKGLFETALMEKEIVRAVRFPLPRRAGYAKFAHPASRYALVGVFVAETSEGVRLAVTGAGPGVFRVPAYEAALTKRFEPSVIEAGTVAPADLSGDIHGSAEYRAHLIAVMARRAVAAATTS